MEKKNKNTFDNFFKKSESEKTEEEKQLEFEQWKKDIVSYWRNYHLSWKRKSEYEI